MGSTKGKSIRRMALTASLAALAIVMGYVESLVPIPLPVPGIKLGIANIVTVCAIFLLSFPEAAVISLIRVLVISFLFGNFTSMLYSLAGMAAALLIMWILWKCRAFSLMGVSIGGGAAHGAGQIAAAFFLLRSPALLYYLPVLLVCGALCGLVNGALSLRILGTLNKSEKLRGFADRSA